MQMPQQHTLGAFGAGGLGNLAYRFGYQRYQKDVMYVCILPRPSGSVRESESENQKSRWPTRRKSECQIARCARPDGGMR